MNKKVISLVALAFVLPVMTALAFHPNKNCNGCHLPHEKASLDGMPLWSGTITTLTDFIEYSSDTLDAVPGDPEGSTLLCLACHDGVNGRHAVSDGTGDLSTSHPIEFVYDTQLATEDGELVNPDEAGSSTLVNGDGTITEDLLNPETRNMNCISCHDIHVQGLHEATGGGFQFSVPHLKNIPGIEMTVSWGGDPTDQDAYGLSYGVLCRTCHIK